MNDLCHRCLSTVMDWAHPDTCILLQKTPTSLQT